MYSVCNTLAGGFPHSEISGSKLICQLPEAYRRLPRPSSPVIAKASTICTYSLDPITLMPANSKLELLKVFYILRYTKFSSQEPNIETQSHVADGTAPKSIPAFAKNTTELSVDNAN